MNSQEYIEVAIKIAPYSEENAEIVTAEVSELPYESFSMEDPFLKCYIQKDLYDAQALKVLLSGLEGMGFDVEFSANLMPAVNWNAVWESQFPPIVVDGKCTIKASFHEGLKRTRFNITIDPKMAFGTGHHQTTYMMCRALIENEESVRGKVVMDMGCGTGVLAILAAKMGAVDCVAVDNDSWAAENAKENVIRNGVDVDVFLGDSSLLKGDENYEIFIANINRNILLDNMEIYSKSIKSGGVLFLSGFYENDIPILENKCAELGFVLSESRTKDNWAAMRLVKTK